MNKVSILRLILSRLRLILSKIENWWHGEFNQSDKITYSPLLRIIFERISDHLNKEWKFWIKVSLIAMGLYIAYLKL